MPATPGPSGAVRLALALAVAVAVPADELDDEQDEPFELDLPFPTLEAAAKAGDSDAVLDPTAGTFPSPGRFLLLTRYVVAVQVLDLLQLGQSSHTPDFDVHYPNPDGFTPLYWSSWSGCSKCVDMMLQLGADVNQNGYDGASPLMAAASSNFSDVCSQLISGTFSQTYGSILTVILHMNDVPCCWIQLAQTSTHGAGRRTASTLRWISRQRGSTTRSSPCCGLRLTKRPRRSANSAKTAGRDRGS